MKPHDILDDAALETAALFALGSLEPSDAKAYEEHLKSCGPCRAEVARASSTLVDMSRAVAAPPPPGLRARVLDRVARPRVVEPRPRVVVDAQDDSPQSWKLWSSDALGAITLLAADSTGWEKTSLDGIEARRLFVDQAADRVTMLVRMAPGTAYPPHVHGGPEECFVLAGDLSVGDGVTLFAGSYQRMPEGSEHPVQSTKAGCVLLLTSSLHDELLAATP